MKNSILLFSALTLALISCNSSSSKQTLSPSDDIPDSIIVENNKMKDFVESDHSEKSTTFISYKATPQRTTEDNDTTIYEMPVTTAVLENAVDYFRTNNKYKNWNKDDKKLIILKCIAEKDGLVSNIKVLRGGSGNTDLDYEAIRLIKQAKLSPARNEKNEVVRSFWAIAVHFPPE